jgi:glycosyltransferase involved in cell wall biosynthesis/ribosomal protein S27AE
MRIAIDARLNAYRQGGIPQYTRQLLTALAEIAREDQFLSLQHRDHQRPLVVAPNVVRRTVFTPPHHRFEQLTLPLEVLLTRADVLHCPDFVAPLRRTTPAVVTIHDLAFMHYPHLLDDEARAYYGRVKQSTQRAEAIVAVSEATRQDIANLLDIQPEHVDVIHEAAAPIYGRIELRPGEARVLDGMPVAAGTFMLFVSTLEPRKNLPTLLRALRICLDRRPDARYKLVVAGTRGWRDDEIFSTLRDLRLEDHVVVATRVGPYDLRWLYNACRLYINPSLYEGFGLPLLEAMACGAACLASATSSLPEIGGEAALYIPPLEPDQWADAIMELWDDQERRAELGRRGRVQAERFSWVRAARETLAVYRRAAARQPRPAIASPAILPPPVDDERSCPRCGAALVPGQLAGPVQVLADAPESRPQPLAKQAHICPRCGRVLLEFAKIDEPQATVSIQEDLPAPAALPVLEDPLTPASPLVPEAPQNGTGDHHFAADPPLPSVAVTHPLDRSRMRPLLRPLRRPRRIRTR